MTEREKAHGRMSMAFGVVVGAVGSYGLSYVPNLTSELAVIVILLTAIFVFAAGLIQAMRTFN